MEDMLCLALSFLGLMSTLNGQHLHTAVYEEGPHSVLSQSCFFEILAVCKSLNF